MTEETSAADLINWKGLFTTLAGIGIVAVVAFVVAAWNITDDVGDIAKEVQLRAKADEVERQDTRTLEKAKAYTDNKMGDLLRQTDKNSQKLETISESVKEMKEIQRNNSVHVQESLRDISKEMKRIQIDQARNE